jgi:hypothetical protein
MYARVTQQWDADGAVTIEVEVGSDRDAYPDVAAELAARVLELWRETVA